MLACLPNRDTLSGWQHPRKPCPRLSAQNGMRFPDGMPSGNRFPESRPRTGHAFRLNAQRKLHPGIDAQTGPQFPSERQPESASRNRRSEWDALSRRSSLRKACPRMKTRNGMQFPPEGDSESASHSEHRFRVAVSAPNKRPRLAMELGPKAQHIQLMLSANSPSAMAVRAPPYPR